jgi:hypothetical protein
VLGGRSNCLIFALGRFVTRGGYILARRSRWGWWPHFLWASSLHPLRLEHFSPVQGGRPRLLPPLLFKGHILDKDQ